MKILLTVAFLVILGFNSKNDKTLDINKVNAVKNNVVVKNIFDAKAEKLVNESIAAHGGDLYETANYSFVFRNKEYRFANNNGSYTYVVESKNKKNQKINDFIVDGTFNRYVNDEIIAQTNKEKSRYTGALNSVIYFATLPHKLNDVAVNKKYIEETSIKGEQYDVVEVTFTKEGGGQDHDDEFHYWINKQTKKIDYLAYNYRVNNGGVRFRSSYNRRVVDGVTFQDYINWKANVGTPLKELPALFEQGKLKELSRIETENIINLDK